MRFEMIDRVTGREEGRLTAVRSVTSGEEYLADHFPGFPVLPGVLMLEALVQAARRLVAEADNPPVLPLVIEQVRNVRYGQMVRPGQTLKIDVTLRRQDETGYEFQGKGMVEGDVAVQGRFRLAPLAGDGPA
ncbi:MAG: 3-hydroxyacyl-ACP dehydratase FabZ family protein [Phycisphaeraceae bacterium]